MNGFSNFRASHAGMGPQDRANLVETVPMMLAQPRQARGQSLGLGLHIHETVGHAGSAHRVRRHLGRPGKGAMFGELFSST